MEQRIFPFTSAENVITKGIDLIRKNNIRKDSSIEPDGI